MIGSFPERWNSRPRNESLMETNFFFTAQFGLPVVILDPTNPDRTIGAASRSYLPTLVRTLSGDHSAQRDSRMLR
jgi:hypothetical protein